MPFRKAQPEKISKLLIGLAGPSGSGKTYSALKIANAIKGDGRIAYLDTENRGANRYAHEFDFDRDILTPPFRTPKFLDGAMEADSEGYTVLVIDSMSAEWAGPGGVLDWQVEELDRLSKGKSDYKRYEGLSWSRPKQAHKKFIYHLSVLKCHVILCFRANERITIGKDKKTGKQVWEDKKMLPIGGDESVFECEFILMMPDKEKAGQYVPFKANHLHTFIEKTGRIDDKFLSNLSTWIKRPPGVVEEKTVAKEEIKENGVFFVSENYRVLRNSSDKTDRTKEDLQYLFTDAITAYLLDNSDKAQSVLAVNKKAVDLLPENYRSIIAETIAQITKED